MKKYHIHIVTYRASLPINSYNKLIRFLYDNNIKYKYFSKISKTRDDSGLPIYYDRVIFWHTKYIEYRTNRKQISITEYIDKIRQMLDITKAG